LIVDLSLDTNKEIRDKADNILKRMSKYHLNVLQKIGFSVQFFMLDQIKKWGGSEQLQRLSLIKTIFNEMFELEYESSTMEDYRTFSFGFGLLHAGDQLKQIREEAIQLLKALFDNSTTKIADKLVILETLNEISKTPNRGNYSDEIDQLVKENTISLVKWYISLLDRRDIPFEVIKEINKQLVWFKRRHNSIEDLSTLEKKINVNEQYLVFRVLVGYDHDYFSEDMDWREAREKRNEKINGFVHGIGTTNLDYWFEIIHKIIKGIRPGEQGEYLYFNQFLNALALQKPDISKKLIEENENTLSGLLCHLIAGFWKSDNEYAREKMNGWVIHCK
jgi:hypothetical protein